MVTTCIDTSIDSNKDSPNTTLNNTSVTNGNHILCHYVYPNGKRCGCYHMKDSLYCINHNPDIDQGEVISKGLISSYSPQQIVNDPVCVKTFLGRLIVDTLSGKVKPITCNAVVNACDKVLKTIQIADVDTKLQSIIDRMNSSQGYKQIQDMDCLDIEEDDDKDKEKG